MTPTRKITTALLMSATALTGLAGAAHAVETEATLRYNLIDVEVDGGGEAEGSGATLELDGRYDSGFQYDMTYVTADIDEVDGSSIDQPDGSALELNMWYMMGNFGPAATYLYESTEGENALGLGFASQVGSDRARAYASVVTDVEDFGDTWRFRAGGETAINDDASVRAEYQRMNNERDSGLDEPFRMLETVEIGGRYGINERAFIDATYAVPLETGDDHMGIYGIGVGMKF